MTDWHKISRISDVAPLDFGSSIAFPVVPRSAGQPLSLGFSDFVAGVSELDVAKPECFLVCEGEMEISSGDESWQLTRGEAIWMPAGSKVSISVPRGCRIVYAIVMS